jgi:hypothetical protein
MLEAMEKGPRDAARSAPVGYADYLVRSAKRMFDRPGCSSQKSAPYVRRLGADSAMTR